MLLFVSWRNKYAIIEWPLFDAPTSIHGVFTSFSISQYCCLHFWKIKVGSMLAQGFLRVKSQAKITKCYFLWVGAIHLYSFSGRHLMRQKVPMAFFVYKFINDKNARQLKNVLLCQKLRIVMNLPKKKKKMKQAMIIAIGLLYKNGQIMKYLFSFIVNYYSTLRLMNFH